MIVESRVIQAYYLGLVVDVMRTQSLLDRRFLSDHVDVGFLLSLD